MKVKYTLQTLNKKLQLNKETIQELNPGQLSKAVGGLFTVPKKRCEVLSDGPCPSEPCRMKV